MRRAFWAMLIVASIWLVTASAALAGIDWG